MNIAPRAMHMVSLALLACFALASCSGGSQPDVESSGTAAPAFDQIPFPANEELVRPREASGIAAKPIDAVDSFDESDNTSEDGVNRVFDAGPGEISWAMYKFDGLTDWDDLTNIGLEFTELPETYYLGIADFDNMKWKWYKRGTSTGGDNALDAMAWPIEINGISPAGNCYVVALFHDGTGGSLVQAILSWTSELNGPVAYFEADPQRGNAALQVSFDASGTIDQDGVGISKYEWDWEGDGVFDAFGPSSSTQHTYTEVGEYHPTLRATDEDDKLTDTAQLTIRVQGWQHSLGGDGKESIEGVTYQGDNIYAVGWGIITDNEESNYEGLLISYDADGNPRWRKTWGGGLDDDGFAACAGVYSNGLVAVGNSKNFGSVDLGFIIVRFDSNGNEMWARHWDTAGYEFASGVDVDLSGNIVVVGSSNGFDVGPVSDGVVLKYSPSGDLLWEKRLKNTGQTTCQDVDISVSGDIYVAADSTSYSPNCATVFHLDSDGELVKESPLDVGNITHVSGIAVGIFGEVFITGNAHVPNEALLVAGMGSDGNYTWANAGDYADHAFGRGITLRYGQFASITGIFVGGYAYYDEPLKYIGVLGEYKSNGGYTTSYTWIADSRLSFRDMASGRYGSLLLGGSGYVAAAARSNVDSPPLIFGVVNTQASTAVVQDVSASSKSITGNVRDLDGVLDTGGGDQDSWVGSFIPEDL